MLGNIGTFGFVAQEPDSSGYTDFAYKLMTTHHFNLKKVKKYKSMNSTWTKKNNIEIHL